MHYEFIAEAESAFDQAARLSPGDPRWPYLQAILLLNRQPDTAMRKLARAASAGDRPDMPRLRLAEFLTERGEANAADHFRSLLQVDPGHPRALLGLARLRQRQGQLGESTNLLQRCLNSPFTAKSAHALLATIYQTLGDISAAAMAARRSANLPIDAPWPDPYWTEASAYRVGRKALLDDASGLMDQGRLDDAVQVLALATRDYPKEAEAWYLMGWAFNQQQRSGDAERALREHLRRIPDSPKGHAQLAVALLSQNRFEEAVPVLEAAVKLKPTWRELHFNLGYACVQLHRYDEAIRHFRDALTHDPNYVGSYTALADLLSRRGEEGEARELLGQALELDPTDPRTKALIERMDRSR
jgi:tetratricopeptide (TPR) repeat protein